VRTTGARRDVAIKILAEKLSGDEMARQRFQREAARAQLTSEHHHVHDFGEQEGMATWPWSCSGDDLRELIEKHQIGGSRTARDHGADLEGLAFAHSRASCTATSKPQHPRPANGR